MGAGSGSCVLFLSDSHIHIHSQNKREGLGEREADEQGTRREDDKAGVFLVSGSPLLHQNPELGFRDRRRERET